MLFELLNILASFQDYINKMLVKKLDLFIIVYLDDILINIKSLGQSHTETIKSMLDVL